MKKLFLSLFIFTAMIITLAFYNYRLAQKRLAEARPTQFSIELIDVLSGAQTDIPIKFTWRVSAPESFLTGPTGIYYGYDSTPSAATKLDSPKAVAYPNFTPDYATGTFKLPDIFDVNLAFNRPGKVFFRAYALVGGDHVWSEERSLLVK